MYCAQTALYEKAATLRVIQKFVMLIAIPLDPPSEDYSTRPLISLEPEQNPFLVLLDAERTMEVLTLASYRTADDGVGTLHITTNIQQMLSSPIPPISD